MCNISRQFLFNVALNKLFYLISHHFSNKMKGGGLQSCVVVSFGDNSDEPSGSDIE